MEIVKLIPTWKNIGAFPLDTEVGWVDILTNLINIADTSLPTTSLCFDVLDLTIYNDFEGKGELTYFLFRSACTLN